MELSNDFDFKYAQEVSEENEMVETFFSDKDAGMLIANFCFINEVSVINSPQANGYICFINGKHFLGKTFMGALLNGMIGHKQKIKNNL